MSAANPAPPGDRTTVLQVLPSLVTGGAERGCVDVAAALVRAGGRAIVASAGGQMVRELERAGAEHVTLPLDRKNPLVLRRNIDRLAELIEAEGVHLVHARSRAPAWSAHYAARRTGRPFVTTFHAPYNFSNRAKRFYNSVMARGDRVIAVSDYVARHVAENYGVGPDRLRTIPRGVDPAVFHPDSVTTARLIALAKGWNLPDGAPVILLPARLTRWKGHGVLLRAIAHLGRRDLRCLFVGSAQGRDNYRRELEAEIDRLGLGAVAQMVDHCSDMAAAYKLSTVVCHCSVEPEAFGRVIAESLAMGRPTIATALGAPPEVMPPGLGWLVPPDDPPALAAALEAALALDDAGRAAYAAAAMPHVRAHFTKDLMCDRTLAVYDELLGHAPAGA